VRQLVRQEAWVSRASIFAKPDVLPVRERARGQAVVERGSVSPRVDPHFAEVMTKPRLKELAFGL
jgi:hypothetical protein